MKSLCCNTYLSRWNNYVGEITTGKLKQRSLPGRGLFQIFIPQLFFCHYLKQIVPIQVTECIDWTMPSFGMNPSVISLDPQNLRAQGRKMAMSITESYSLSSHHVLPLFPLFDKVSPSKINNHLSNDYILRSLYQEERKITEGSELPVFSDFLVILF
jgi:hypothetical protein